jgi:hypothetical protein
MRANAAAIDTLPVMKSIHQRTTKDSVTARQKKTSAHMTVPQRPEGAAKRLDAAVSPGPRRVVGQSVASPVRASPKGMM